jgi:hypothetical protein
MESKYLLIIIAILLITYYLWNDQKHIQIKEKKNKEYFLVISDDDQILKNEPGTYQCSQYRRQDLQDVLSMDIIR